MDVRLVMHVHGTAERIKTRAQFASIEAIGQPLAKEVQEAGGDLSKSPWKPLEAAPAASAQPMAKENAILVFAADGSLDIGQLKNVFGVELNWARLSNSRPGSRAAPTLNIILPRLKVRSLPSSTLKAARR